MAGSIVLQIKVRPNARASVLEEPGADGFWQARLRAAPVDGHANQELIALVAQRFGCRRSAVRIRSGASGRRKLVCVELP